MKLQIKYLIGRVRINKRTARAAGTSQQSSGVLCKRRTWNHHIWGYANNLNTKSLFPIFKFSAAQRSLLLVYFANIVECKQAGLISKWSQLGKGLLKKWLLPCRCRCHRWSFFFFYYPAEIVDFNCCGSVTIDGFSLVTCPFTLKDERQHSLKAWN